MKLLLDIGNTAMKWRYGSREAVTVHPAGDSLDVSALDVIKQRPDMILVASVAGELRIQQLSHYCHARWSMQPWVAQTADEAVGIRCAYDNASRLGVDRWLAVLAAGTEPTLVADCGTAVTLDWVEPGQHHGGWIVPGVRLMQQSLLGRTAQIFDIGEADYELAVAADTAPAVAGGAWMAVAGLLERAARRVLHESDKPVRLLLCGGDGERLMPWLQQPPSSENASVNSAPEAPRWQLQRGLVLEGLLLLAEAHPPELNSPHWLPARNYSKLRRLA